MAHKIPATSLIATLMLLSSCGPAANDPGPGGVTVEDAEALDEAAAKLDSEREAAAAPQSQDGQTP